MRKYYKVASFVLAGALATTSFVPILAYAEEDSVAEQEASESVQETTVETTEVSENVENLEITETPETLETPETTETSETTEETIEQQEEKTEEELLAELEKFEADNELVLDDPKDGEDFNEDGISDLMTKALCDGEILTADGKKVFGDYSYARVQMSNDIDGDGLLNGEEIKIEMGEDGHEYAILLSDPCKKDTDDDGIPDIDDTDKWEYGLAGGVVGSVRLVARYDAEQGPTHGHVYIVYTSYVDNLEISIDDLYGYYVTTDEYREKLNNACDNPDEASIVSWRSTVDEITEANEAQRKAAADAMYAEQEHEQHTAGKVTLNRGDYVSIGNYGMSTKQDTINNDYLPKAQELFKDNIEDLTQIYNAIMGDEVSQQYVNDNFQEILVKLGENSTEFVDHVLNGTTPGGVYINRELYNQKYAYDQGPNEVIEKDITKDQLNNEMLKSFSENSYFNTFSHNCSTVGAQAWNDTFGYEKDENGNYITDENGEKVKSAYYANSSVETKVKGVGKDINIKFSCPAFVSASISAMTNLPGYLGHLTYVTGKKITNTIVEAAKRFDISKLFVKKNAADSNKAENNSGTGTNTNTGSNNSWRNESHQASNSASIVNPEEIAIELASDGSAMNKSVVEDKKPASVSKKTGKSKSVIDSTEEEIVEEAEEEIVQKSPVEEKEILEEETPLAIEEESEPTWWIWAVAVAGLTVVGVTTGSLVYRKMNK